MSPDSATTTTRRPAGTDLLGAVDLDVTGMTCAACASRIERKLNKLDGVTASVNYATEKARVRVVNSMDAIAPAWVIAKATALLALMSPWPNVGSSPSSPMSTTMVLGSAAAL